MFSRLSFRNVFLLKRRMLSTEARLAECGITLPEVRPPAGSYVATKRVTSSNVIFTSGQLPVKEDGNLFLGKVGDDLSIEEAQEAAKRCAIQMIAAVKAEVKDLDKVHVKKVVGFVNATSCFTEHPSVLNGCSDFLFEIFGARGIHARSAVGVSSLPFGVPVEVEFILEIESGL
eukprot:g3701.t1